MTKTFKIEVGAIEAIYEGETEDAAILAYVHDAGYETVAKAAEVCGQTEDQFLADITISEVK